jgi:molybdate transport system substrate-binding protein
VSRRVAIAVGVSVTVVLAVGIALAGQMRGSNGPATVLAAASLLDVVPKVDPDVRVSFGGSNQLAQQARLGFPFDVFLSASPVYTRALYADEVTRKPVPFATNRLVVIVPRGNPAGIRAIADLAHRQKLRLVVGAPKVPIGLYTREVLKRLGLLPVLRKTVSLESDVKGIVSKVALGEADAGLVYATDVKPVAGKVRVVAIPARAQPIVVYEAAIAAKPRDLAQAEAFVIALLGPTGRKALRTAGFGVPA